jgi:hypothetical protein
MNSQIANESQMKKWGPSLGVTRRHGTKPLGEAVAISARAGPRKSNKRVVKGNPERRNASHGRRLQDEKFRLPIIKVNWGRGMNIPIGEIALVAPAVGLCQGAARNSGKVGEHAFTIR